MGVEAKDRNLGIRYPEVPFQGGLHYPKFPYDGVLAYGLGDVPKGNMARDNSNLKLVAYHYHGDVVGTEFLLEILRVAGVCKAFGIHCPFVDGGGDKDVYEAVLEVLDGCLQGRDGVFGAFRGALAGLCVNAVREAVHKVHLALLCVLCALDHVDVHGLYVVESLAVESHEL